MMVESKHDILSPNDFDIDYGDESFNALNANTFGIKLNTDSKTVIIDLYYTRSVFRLNKVLQKGLGFNLKYNSNVTNCVLNTWVTIIDISFNLSKENGHKPAITLYCTYE